MDTLTLIIGVIAIILWLIQFFKICGMATNVKKMRAKKEHVSSKYSALAAAVARKDPNAEQMMFDSLFVELRDCITAAYYGEVQIEIVNRYKKLYQFAGFDYPSELDFVDKSQYYNYFSQFTN